MVYRKLLAGIPGLHFVHPPEVAPSNYYAFPVLIGPEHQRTRDEVYFRLREHKIFARRYFYPVLSDHPMYSQSLSPGVEIPNARSAASRILCLPMYPDLTEAEQMRIADVIR
jgi:dTDP-4-amino-4,6-dideoxygalactose transaminase